MCACLESVLKPPNGGLLAVVPPVKQAEKYVQEEGCLRRKMYSAQQVP